MGGMKEFGKRLVELRTERKMKQQDLADALNVSRTAVASWETGHRTPDVKHLDQIASLFGVSVDYLLGRTERRTESLPDWFENLRPEWQKAITENEKIAALVLRAMNRMTAANLPLKTIERLLENQIESYEIIQDMVKEDNE